MSEAKRLFLLLLAVAIFIALAGLLVQGRLNWQSLFPKKPTVKTATIDNVEIELLLARTAQERQQGLSDREKLQDNQGMLFIFDQQDVEPAFWMKDMRFGVDMLWINDNKIVQINENVEPEPGVSDSNLKLYAPSEPIDYVLELNAGTAQKNNFKVGDSIDLAKAL
jgi:uncharacterized membrane protein (UPF0127 family)